MGSGYYYKEEERIFIVVAVIATFNILLKVLPLITPLESTGTVGLSVADDPSGPSVVDGPLGPCVADDPSDPSIAVFQWFESVL